MARKLKVLPPRELVLPEDQKARTLNEDRVKTSKDFKTLAEQVAQSSVFHRNWYVPEMRERFKHFDRMKRVDIVFPYARTRGNPEMLLVDMPANGQEVEQCALKAKILAGHGYLYCYIEKDSSLGEVLMQIGEL